VVSVKGITKFGEVDILITGIIIYEIILKNLPRRRVKNIIKPKFNYIIFEVNYAVIRTDSVIINDAIMVNRVDGYVINNTIKLLSIIGGFISLS